MQLHLILFLQLHLTLILHLHFKYTFIAMRLFLLHSLALDTSKILSSQTQVSTKLKATHFLPKFLA